MQSCWRCVCVGVKYYVAAGIECCIRVGDVFALVLNPTLALGLNIESVLLALTDGREEKLNEKNSGCGFMALNIAICHILTTQTRIIGAPNHLSWVTRGRLIYVSHMFFTMHGSLDQLFREKNKNNGIVLCSVNVKSGFRP